MKTLKAIKTAIKSDLNYFKSQDFIENYWEPLITGFHTNLEQLERFIVRIECDHDLCLSKDKRLWISDNFDNYSSLKLENMVVLIIDIKEMLNDLKETK